MAKVAELTGSEEKYRAAMEEYEKYTKEFYRQLAAREEVKNDFPLRATTKFDGSTVVVEGEEYEIMPEDMGDQPLA